MTAIDPWTPNQLTSPPYAPQTPGFSSVVNAAVPGMPGLSQSASNIVKSQLGGMPGTSTARRANAYFGGASGVPGSDFVRNRGFDLYNMQGEQRQQQGIQNLLALLQGFSGPMLQERGQEINRDQFGADLAQRKLESDRNYGLARMQANKLYKPKYTGLVGTTDPAHNIFTPSGAYTEWLRNPWN